MKLQDSVALVTGGARRVGQAIALELARAGCDVIVHCYSSRDEAEATASQIAALGRKCWVVAADLAKSDAVSVLNAGLASVPPVDVLVNSASVFWRTPLEGLTEDQFDATLAINLRAPFFLARHFGLAMKSRGRGRIINVADAAVRRPYRNYAAYLISKSALVAATEVLALELAPVVQVNTVAPGTVLMPEDADADLEALIIRKTPLKRTGDPSDVAAMVRHLAEAGDFMTGGYYAVDGGSGI